MLPGLSSLALAKATSRPTALCFCLNFSIANLMLLVVNDGIKLKLCSLVFDIFCFVIDNYASICNFVDENHVLDFQVYGFVII